jgi:hypothetical protein
MSLSKHEEQHQSKAARLTDARPFYFCISNIGWNA